MGQIYVTNCVCLKYHLKFLTSIFDKFKIPTNNYEADGQVALNGSKEGSDWQDAVGTKRSCCPSISFWDQHYNYQPTFLTTQFKPIPIDTFCLVFENKKASRRFKTARTSGNQEGKLKSYLVCVEKNSFFYSGFSRFSIYFEVTLSFNVTWTLTSSWKKNN